MGVTILCNQPLTGVFMDIDLILEEIIGLKGLDSQQGDA